MTTNNEFDLAIVGGGSSGLAAAKAAGASGARVVVVEKARIGGADLWTGRVPMRALMKAARVYDTVKRAAEFGIRVENPRLVWNAVQLRIAAVRDEIKALEREALTQAGVETIYGEARFENANTLCVATKNGERNLRAAKFILATGSELSLPRIEGLPEIEFLTQSRMFEMKNLPRSWVIVGGGPRGCEIAQTLTRLGCKVTLLQAASTLLPAEDEDVSDAMEKLLRNEGVEIFCNARVLRARGEGEKKQLEFTVRGETQSVTASEVLVVADGVPRTDGLNLEAANVRWNGQGIAVNEYLQTSAGNVWACGGVTGNAHAAPLQGAVAARNALEAISQKFDDRAEPRMVWTDPEVARLGLTEAQARGMSEDVEVQRQEFSRSEHAIVEGETHGFLKVVTNSRGELLGVHIIGANAHVLIERFVVAMREKASLTPGA
jgi:pyruvate/2-oxoglutarate dehydrogenase complex dihydrolipoamide dehydrogenase (E3) component